MNSFGEFLYVLRKEKGITQAELAQSLGVTNKAVSKWETGEAMPETSLLLPISRIFGVSVDELLEGKRSAAKEEKDDIQNFKDHIFTRGKDDSERKSLNEKIQVALCATVVFAATTAYLLIGIICGLWHPYWVIVAVGGLLSGIIGVIFDAFNARKREYKLAHGQNPYTGAVCATVMLSCVIAFMLCGAFLNLWHPLWIILVVGAFSCGIIAMIMEIINHRKK